MMEKVRWGNLLSSSFSLLFSISFAAIFFWAAAVSLWAATTFASAAASLALSDAFSSAIVSVICKPL